MVTTLTSCRGPGSSQKRYASRPDQCHPLGVNRDANEPGGRTQQAYPYPGRGRSCGTEHRRGSAAGVRGPPARQQLATQDGRVTNRRIRVARVHWRNATVQTRRPPRARRSLAASLSSAARSAASRSTQRQLRHPVLRDGIALVPASPRPAPDYRSPVIIETISSPSVSTVARIPTCFPRRRTQMRSEIRNTWSRL